MLHPDLADKKNDSSQTHVALTEIALEMTSVAHLPMDLSVHLLFQVRKMRFTSQSKQTKVYTEPFKTILVKRDL